MVRLGTEERGKEPVVDVDDPVRMGIHERSGEHLHVPSEHDEVHLVLREELQITCSCAAFVSGVTGRWTNSGPANATDSRWSSWLLITSGIQMSPNSPIRQRLGDRRGSAPVSTEMAIVAGRSVNRSCQLMANCVGAAQRPARSSRATSTFEIELDAHERRCRPGGRRVARRAGGCPRTEDELRDRGHRSWPVRARQEQDRRPRHDTTVPSADPSSAPSARATRAARWRCRHLPASSGASPRPLRRSRCAG